MSRFRRALVILGGLLLLSLAAYTLNVGLGMLTGARTSGTTFVRGLSARAQIVRDTRGIPHIRASNIRDAYFAEGYAQGSDRLFQMDLIRRFVAGRLAEVLGNGALAADEHARIVPVSQIVAAQWQRLSPQERAQLQAFSDGVNEAMKTQPRPVEFRLLMYAPQPWTPQDSLAAGFATVLDLIDDWDDVIRRDDVGAAVGFAAQRNLYSITDPKYDAPVLGKPAPVEPLVRSYARGMLHAAFAPPEPKRQASNEWAVGGAASTNGHALLANDPHLRLGIPGVWYLVELRAPGLHVAGATLAGVPGVVLGHNERIAWGATNGTVVTEVVYRDNLAQVRQRPEIFHVRFAKDVRKVYLQSKHGFVVDDARGYAVDWNALRMPQSPIVAFAALNRARSVSDALRALRSYPGPPQNFVVACADGTAAYHLAGLIPNDPSWGLRVHPASDPLYPFVPFDALPHVDASRGARVFTSNNRMYASGYPYRLSAAFAPPYRAYRVKQLLFARKRHDVGSLFSMQSDTLSLPELELSRDVVGAAKRQHVIREASLAPALRALTNWNGRFDPTSTAATIAYAYRRELLARFDARVGGRQAKAYTSSAQGSDLVFLLRVLRSSDVLDAMQIDALRTAIGTRPPAPWQSAGAVAVQHPLAAVGIGFLNGGVLPGKGDAYSVRVQTTRPASQSFRAVWDTGDWNAGGIIIPSGESGEPGSHHYVDLRDQWTRAQLVPLPFDDAALANVTSATLTLTPARGTP